VWATRDGDRLTVALVPLTELPHGEPSIFDFRVGDQRQVAPILQLYGWSGRQAPDGTLIAFFHDIDVTVREHVFADGQRARVVSSAVEPLPAMAS
jgi:hypothetical protein